MNRHAAVIMCLVGSLLLLACRSDGIDDAQATATVTAVTATGTVAAAPTTAPADSATSTPAAVVTPTAVPLTPTTVSPPAATTAQTQTPAPTTVPVESVPVDAALVAALQSGGYAIFIRIAASGDDGSDTDACLQQRVLDDDALARARAIGVAFQQLAIPVTTVVSNGSCAETVTAQVAFGGFEALNAIETALETGVDPGTNLVIVSDLNDAVLPLGAAAVVPGATAILMLDGAAGAVIAIIQPSDWPMLVGQVNGPAYQQFPVPPGSRSHDVAPAADGGVWYTAQGSGHLGWLDPVTGATRHIALGPGSSPHGVIVGPDGAPWITDSGQNAIVRVDPHTDEVQVFPLPPGTPNTNLNTATFDGHGRHWFTGQNGYYGRVDPATGEVQVWQAPGGRGPYGIDATPGGDVYYASLAGSHIAQIDTATGAATVIEPPTAGQGARRVWSDSQGRIWVSEWNSGQVSVYEPASGAWRAWLLPGDNPLAYAVYVDDHDMVWLSDFGANALVRFDPQAETFESFPLPANPSNVRQVLGRPHEVWGAESAADTLIVLRVP